MIFPKLVRKPFGYVNLNLHAEEWLKDNSPGGTATALPKDNPLLDPGICDRMVNAFHATAGLA
jgi:hypothetical protein